MANEPTHMSLSYALMILCDAHTCDDQQLGFTIHSTIMEPRPEHYVEAWSLVRRAAGYTGLPEQETPYD